MQKLRSNARGEDSFCAGSCVQTHYTTNSQHGPVKLRSNAVVHTAGAPIEICVIGTAEPAVRFRLQQRSVHPNRDGRPALFPTRLEIRKLPPSEISRAMTGNQSTAAVAGTVPQWRLRHRIAVSEPSRCVTTRLRSCHWKNGELYGNIGADLGQCCAQETNPPAGASFLRIVGRTMLMDSTHRPVAFDLRQN